MFKPALMMTVLFALSATATAQNSRFTIFAGYSYANTPIATSQRSNLNGWEGSIEGFRYRPWLTLIADGSGHYGWNEFPISCVTVPVCTPAVPDVRVHEYNLLGGPQFSKFRGNFRIFAHGMGGATHVSVRTSGFFDSSTAWAIATGGGADYKWRGPFSWRLQADYMRTNVFKTGQNMMRASTGRVIRF